MLGSLATKIGLNAISKAISLIRSSNKTSSLIDYTSVARVEPIALIDMDALQHDMLPDVMQSLQSIFSGYYLQAIALSNNINKINIKHHLDKLNPTRDGSLISIGLDMISTESYKFSLPALEAIPLNPPENTTKVSIGTGAAHSHNIDMVTELTNLSVGKMLSVEISDGQNRVSIPISIRLMANAIPSSSIVHILSVGNKDTTFMERYHGWKSGRLEFIRDIVFCQDLIDAHKQEILKDKTGIYGEILKRRKNNALATIASGQPSIATASNILVCTSNTLRTLEGNIGKQLKDFNTRQKLFEGSYLMLIAVIDKEWDRVTIYHRGINLPTEVSMRDLKVSNRNTGPDVMEIMKAFQLGNSPIL